MKTDGKFYFVLPALKLPDLDLLIPKQFHENLVFKDECNWYDTAGNGEFHILTDVKTPYIFSTYFHNLTDEDKTALCLLGINIQLFKVDAMHANSDTSIYVRFRYE